MSEDQEPSFLEEQCNGKTILVIEDDQDISELIRLALAEENSYYILLVPDPSQALQVAKSKKVNLLIIDYYLANTNGIAFYDTLHAIPELQQVPAIILSASIEKLAKKLEERNLVGVAKPFELDELLEIIAKVVNEPASSVSGDKTAPKIC